MDSHRSFTEDVAVLDSYFGKLGSGSKAYVMGGADKSQQWQIISYWLWIKSLTCCSIRAAVVFDTIAEIPPVRNSIAKPESPFSAGA